MNAMLRTVLLLLAAVASPLPAVAATGAWSWIGPEGGLVFDVVGDPTVAATAYASTLAGIFKTTDGGASWSRVGIVQLRAPAVAASNPSILYATGVDPAAPSYNGVFKSVDAGASWTQVLATGILDPARPISLAVDPSNPSIVYAGTNGDGLLKTVDGGAHWAHSDAGITDTFAGKASVSRIVVDPQTPSTVFASTCCGEGLYKSTNSGSSWAPSNSGAPGGGLIYLDPQTPSTAYLLGASPYKSIDGGATWTPAGAGLPIGARALAIDPTTPSVVYAAMNDPGVPTGGLYKSIDAGATFSPTGCTDISASGATVRPNGDVLVSATDNISYGLRGGVYRSTDGGASCPLSSSGISTFNAVALAAAGTVYMGDGDTGAYRSTDGGATWSEVHSGLTGINKIVHALVVDPAAPSTVYQTSGNTLNDRLWKSGDSGDSWLAVRGPASFYQSLAINPVDPENVFIGLEGAIIGPTFIQASVERTTDGGSTWSTTSLTSLQVPALLVDPMNPSIIYAGTENNLRRSVDGGATFSFLGSGLPLGQPVIGLVIDPTNPSVMYGLAVNLHSSTPGGVFKSVDGGATWAPRNNGLPSLYLTTIAFDPTPPGSLSVGGDSIGMFRSIDGGTNWFAVNQGLFDPRIRSLAVDPTVPGRIYAGTRGSSVFVRDFPPPCPPGSDGEPCDDDGDLCTNDRCDGLGACTHVFAPDPLCIVPTPRGGSLRIVNRAGTGTDQVKFKFAKGPAIDLDDFGAPNDDTAYALCVYDETPSGPTLAYRGRPLPPCNATPCWTALPTGWKLRSTGGPDGITSVLLKRGLVGKAKLQVAARRSGLALPALPLVKSPSVVAELRTSEGACWGATFSSPTKTDAVQFNARSD